VTIYLLIFADHGLHLDRGERVLINQGCTFLDYARIRLGEGVMIHPKVTRITSLPGVTIVRGAMIAAGAVVADDVLAASVVTGPKATVHRRWGQPPTDGIVDPCGHVSCLWGFQAVSEPMSLRAGFLLAALISLR
jgi:acetyltransferase-like isoleucine patch superfamily enzyme